MKTILIWLLLCNAALAQCPIYGDNSKPELRHLDSLKNRSIIPDASATLIPLDSFLYSKHFPLNQFSEIKVYLFDAKISGKESCNCHSNNKEDYDYHLTVTRDSLHTSRPDRIICEITPRLRGQLNIKYIKQMVGHMVTIQGYNFDDTEHKQNALISNPKGTNVWRITTREIHPITNIFIEK